MVSLSGFLVCRLETVIFENYSYNKTPEHGAVVALVEVYM
jgi:hypothetical protein